MSFLKNLFGTSEKTSETQKTSLDWNPLTTPEELKAAILLSFKKPVIFFKHSTSCSVSRMVLKQFEKEYNGGDIFSLQFVDLLNYREISNNIAERLQVQHESPQLILIKNGQVLYHASHSDISGINLQEKI